MVRKIIQDETWLEGERRGCPVPELDVVVSENVCRIVLDVGGQMRGTAIRGGPSFKSAPMRWIESARIAIFGPAGIRQGRPQRPGNDP